MLNANNTKIQNDAITGIAAINKLMKSKGYKYKTFKHSALFSTDYTKEGSDTRITVCGWHGDGRYSDVKTILDLFVGKISTVVGLQKIVGDANDPSREAWCEVNAKLHKEGIDIILEYLKINA
jgi:hypothetical protein